MLDALNSIVEFLNLIIQSVHDFIWAEGIFFRFLLHGAVFLSNLITTFIPVQFLPFALVTLSITIVMLIFGRTNNS